jgi:hypothetical protein
MHSDTGSLESKSASPYRTLLKRYRQLGTEKILAEAKALADKNLRETIQFSTLLIHLHANLVDWHALADEQLKSDLKSDKRIAKALQDRLKKFPKQLNNAAEYETLQRKYESTKKTLITIENYLIDILRSLEKKSAQHENEFDGLSDIDINTTLKNISSCLGNEKEKINISAKKHWDTSPSTASTITYSSSASSITTESLESWNASNNSSDLNNEAYPWLTNDLAQFSVAQFEARSSLAICGMTEERKIIDVLNGQEDETTKSNRVDAYLEKTKNKNGVLYTILSKLKLAALSDAVWLNNDEAINAVNHAFKNSGCSIILFAFTTPQPTKLTLRYLARNDISLNDKQVIADFYVAATQDMGDRLKKIITAEKEKVVKARRRLSFGM